MSTTTVKSLAERLDEARRELDQCAEWLARIADDTRAIEAGDIPPVVGIREGAALMGISPDAFRKRHERGLIPMPAFNLATGPIWLRSQILTLRFPDE